MVETTHPSLTYTRATGMVRSSELLAELIVERFGAHPRCSWRTNENRVKPQTDTPDVIAKRQRILLAGR